MPFADPAVNRVYQREWARKNAKPLTPEQRARASANYLARYHRMGAEGRRKARIYATVQRAVKSGKLVKEPCLFCDRADTHAHHHDYDKPLDVTWLCPDHHGRIHAR